MNSKSAQLPSYRKSHFRFMLRCLLFLLLIVLLTLVIRQQLLAGFLANPYLNGLILLLLAFGVLFSLYSMKVTWTESNAVDRAESILQHAADNHAGHEDAEQLLANTMPAGINHFLQTVKRIIEQGDSSSTLPYLLDSLAAKAEDRRALVRFLSGTLVLLGLVGTFYGLLITIGGVEEVLNGLSGTGQTDLTLLLEDIKSRLSVPLDGMALAFSSSLYGLASSLILTFMELQLFHAQNDLHGRTETLVVSSLVPFWRPHSHQQGANRSTTREGFPPYIGALLETTVEHLERTTSKLDRLALWQKDEAHPVGLALAQVAKALEALGHEVGQQQQERTESLAAEIRLLNRTLAKMEDRSHETQA